MKTRSHNDKNALAVPTKCTAVARQIQILLVEDHCMFREQLAKAIGAEDDLAVCGEAADVAAGLHMIKQISPDLVVVDISLRESSGIALIEAMETEGLQVPVLVLSMYEEMHYAERAIKAGARGYVSKQESSRQVIVGIRKVMSGEVFLSPRISALRPKFDTAIGATAPGVLGQWVVHLGRWFELDPEAICLFAVEQAPWSQKPLPVLVFKKTPDLMMNKGSPEDWLPEDWPPVELKITVERIS